MKIIKLFVFFFSASVFFSSCGEDCEVTNFKDTLVGTWYPTGISDKNSDNVTFNADGTGSALENSFFAAELNEVESTEFNWTYDESTMDLNIEWVFPDLGKSNVDYNIKSFDCDEIIMNLFVDISISKL